MLDETAHQSLIAALDVAISRCVDAFNIASESDDPELAEGARTPGDRAEGVPASRCIDQPHAARSVAVRTVTTR